MSTLLIPTMNRSDFLIRLLRYYSGLGFAGNMCIGDSSNPEHVERAKRFIETLQGSLNIDYKEYPHLNGPECVEELLNFVSTPYAVWVADDDFLVPSALERCVRFLDNHQDYSAAHGVAVVITARSSGAHGPVVSAGHYKQPVAEGGSASQRLLDHLGSYSSTLFSVHRVESFREMYRDISSIKDWAFAGEILQCCLSVIQGKIKELDCLYMVRQVHSQRYLFPDVYDWVTGPHWLPSYEVCRDRVAEELVRQDGISMEAARDVVKQAFWSYLSRALTKKWGGQYGRNNLGLRGRARSLARGVPPLRQTWLQLRSFVPSEKYKLSLPALLRPTSRYHSDFMPIYRAVSNVPN